MFKIQCCKKKVKCRVWMLSSLKNEAKFLKQAICPVCGQKIAIVERKTWNDKISFVRKNDEEAEELIEKVSCDILYELLPTKINERHGFYLQYSEYGKIKKCFSNLSTLRLGRIKNNFDDVCLKKVQA